MSRQAVVGWERRWAVPTAIATFLVVVLLIAATAARSSISGDGAADVLRAINDHHGSLVLNGALQALAFLLLTAPLFYLFRAARSRSERVRSQIVGLVLIAPLFIALSSGLSIGARSDAADQLVAGEASSSLTAKEAKEDCASDREDENAKEFREEFEPRAGESALAACERTKLEDDEAEEALRDASLATVSSGLGLAGGLALVVALFYSCLWAMRTGLLTRFWGSLGMAAGITFLLGPLVIIALVWLVYFALLVVGLVPGGRPPAWEAGEAIPWPTPGERAAEELEPAEPDGESAESDDEPAGAEPDEKRKRKQRD